MSPAHPGVSADVWAHDQVSRVERILFSLRDAPMRFEEVERLERILTAAHEQNVERAREQVRREEGVA